jgi:archaemetzincin
MKAKLIIPIIILCIVISIIYWNNSSKKVPFISKKEISYKSDTILILNLEFKETKLLKPIMEKVTSFYHLPVVLKSAKLPPYAYYKTGNRYRADSILNFLERYNKKHFRFIAALTSKDISHTNIKKKVNDYGIIGLGSLNNKGCITSSFRIKTNVTESKLLERLQKVILHEIGHNHGLTKFTGRHCNSAYPCFMKDALGKKSTVDKWPMNLCKDCREDIGLKP